MTSIGRGPPRQVSGLPTRDRELIRRVMRCVAARMLSGVFDDYVQPAVGPAARRWFLRFL